MKKVSTFKTALSGISDIPDPLNIFTINQWYILDSVSDTLVRFNHVGGTYEPVIAESWEKTETGFNFLIKSGLKFHDGSPLSVEDVAASFRRVTRLKTSTHFAIWNYLEDCKGGPCRGIRVDGKNIILEYKGDPSALFMFLSSPEGAIWAREDVQGSEFKPVKYSGFYYPFSLDGMIKLKANFYSTRRKDFPNAPENVDVLDLPRTESISAVKNGALDAVMMDYTPFSTQLVEAEGLSVSQTVPITFVYLLKLGNKSSKPFNSQFLRSVWATKESSNLLSAANGLLPPGVEGGLDNKTVIDVFDAKSEESPVPVTIGYLPSYHSEDFASVIGTAAKSAGIEIKLRAVNRDDFYKAVTSPKTSPLDYMLLGYLVSDKFPMAQLKLILNDFELPFDFDTPKASSEDLISSLGAIQKKALEEQLIVPLYFAPVLRIARKDISIGNQPTTDGELQYWRVNEEIE